MALILDRHGRVRAACRNPLTLVGRDICPSHIYEVWDLIPKHIIESLQKGYGYRIPGLVSFGCKQITNSFHPQIIAVDKYIHMLVAEDLAKICGLKVRRPAYTLNTSNSINLSRISCELNMPRYAVDACITEVIDAFKRAIVTYRQVNLVFDGIGTLIVRDGVVSNCFDPCFLKLYGYDKRLIQHKSYPCVCPPCQPLRNCAGLKPHYQTCPEAQLPKQTEHETEGKKAATTAD